MKARVFQLGMIGLVLSFAATALANSWSSFFTLVGFYQDNTTGGYVIQPNSVANNAQNDPANCVPAGGTITRYFLSSSLSAADKDLLNKMLLGAYLAGRGIQVQVASAGTTPCVAGQPTIVGAAMDAAH
ncbi:MAG TPA: hypothetical protein VER11_32390 [Polyangiaceae bacterium]|nr:hypothetical protein [Polyangiaceae bacterium]